MMMTSAEKPSRQKRLKPLLAKQPPDRVLASLLQAGQRGGSQRVAFLSQPDLTYQQHNMSRHLCRALHEITLTVAFSVS